MLTHDFYELLPSVTEFIDLVNPDYYTKVPADWYILITDVVGSTKAIDAGRYKDVNFLGACSIIAVLNAVDLSDLPFIFGGDGSSMLVPPAYLTQARDALIGLRSLAYRAFNIDLRIGIVPVSILPEEHALRIAKVQITPRYSQASFLGGGMTYATDLIKQDPNYRLDILNHLLEPDLTGMECRWQEVLSRYGDTLSLIVAVLPSSSKPESVVYREVLEKIQQIYGDEQAYHPLATTTLKLSFSPKALNSEVKARARSITQWSRFQYLMQLWLEISLGWLFMKLGLNVANVNWGQYKHDVCIASDYQKIDDILRMVIAGTPSQTAALNDYLDHRCQCGDLAYGIHVSDRALLTCMIFDRRDRHIHLIDAADGGYALAAKTLKTQMFSATSNDCSIQQFSDIVKG